MKYPAILLVLIMQTSAQAASYNCAAVLNSLGDRVLNYIEVRPANRTEIFKRVCADGKYIPRGFYILDEQALDDAKKSYRNSRQKCLDEFATQSPACVNG